MNKKVLSLLLVLTLLFVACGQDTPATEAATEAGTEATVTEAADTEATETQTDDTEEAADDGEAKIYRPYDECRCHIRVVCTAV